jgi:predicted acetyltransferase
LVIRLLEKSDIHDAKVLWKEAFNDSDAFIDWYFKNKVLPGHSLGMFDGGLISVVHLIPYRVSVQGRPFESMFIAGAATAKHRQGEGLMRTLLLKALWLMKERRILITYLYPFKHSFYEKFGWTAYSYVYKKSTAAAKRSAKSIVIETDDYRILNPIYRKMMSFFDGYVIRGQREWQWRLSELAADGGKTAVLVKNNEATAYMLYYGGKTAEIIEMVYMDEKDIHSLLAYVLGGGAKRADYFIPALSGEHAEKHAMARIVDARGLLAAFGAEDLMEEIDITDDFAQWNNTQKTHREALSINKLTEIVHRGLYLHDLDIYADNRLYSKLCCKTKDIFSNQNTCIFEAF